MCRQAETEPVKNRSWGGAVRGWDTGRMGGTFIQSGPTHSATHMHCQTSAQRQSRDGRVQMWKLVDIFCVLLCFLNIFIQPDPSCDCACTMPGTWWMPVIKKEWSEKQSATNIANRPNTVQHKPNKRRPRLATSRIKIPFIRKKSLHF